ncbi:hypothetical protein [Acinetobacter sp.]|uniref:hypothetical protein n=1 Tax=Acinetobacter sp. TaxID=472 RepID=UPI003CFBEA48
MAIRIFGEICIGGRVTESQLAEIADLLTKEGGILSDLEYDYEKITPADIIKAVEIAVPYKLVYASNTHAPYGAFPELEKYLEDNNIAYDRLSEPYDSFDGMIVRYRPGIGKATIPTTATGDEVVPMSSVNKALELLINGKTEDGIKLLEDYVVNYPELESFMMMIFDE